MGTLCDTRIVYAMHSPKRISGARYHNETTYRTHHSTCHNIHPYIHICTFMHTHIRISYLPVPLECSCGGWAVDCSCSAPFAREQSPSALPDKSRLLRAYKCIYTYMYVIPCACISMLIWLPSLPRSAGATSMCFGFMFRCITPRRWQCARAPSS
jgi:hypothetical protein